MGDAKWVSGTLERGKSSAYSYSLWNIAALFKFDDIPE
jgi:hypothetical protein